MQPSPKSKIKTVDEYLATFPKNIRDILEGLRKAIKKSAPEAEEVISYQMPAFKLKGILLYYAAWKEHIGFYPTSSATVTFKKELSAYEVSKGTVRFPIDQPLPIDLITKIVKFRVQENLEKAKARKV
jgi:uncharacterized protein YdhG (YjbR/CyaY superfamily)